MKARGLSENKSAVYKVCCLYYLHRRVSDCTASHLYINIQAINLKSKYSQLLSHHLKRTPHLLCYHLCQIPYSLVPRPYPARSFFISAVFNCEVWARDYQTPSPMFLFLTPRLPLQVQFLLLQPVPAHWCLLICQLIGEGVSKPETCFLK